MEPDRLVEWAAVDGSAMKGAPKLLELDKAPIWLSAPPELIPEVPKAGLGPKRKARAASNAERAAVGTTIDRGLERFGLGDFISLRKAVIEERWPAIPCARPFLLG